jgi:hypothetical protein
LLQTCMYRISNYSTFLELKTLGAVIKFCLKRNKMFVLRKMLLAIAWQALYF